MPQPVRQARRNFAAGPDLHPSDDDAECRGGRSIPTRPRGLAGARPVSSSPALARLEPKLRPSAFAPQANGETMNSVIYLIGLVVVVLAILSFIGIA